LSQVIREEDLEDEESLSSSRPGNNIAISTPTTKKGSRVIEDEVDRPRRESKIIDKSTRLSKTFNNSQANRRDSNCIGGSSLALILREKTQDFESSSVTESRNASEVEKTSGS
jgi:hypothetical protein